MSDVWITIVALTVTTALIRSFGPVAFGGRDLPGLAMRMITLLAPALLAALVVIQTFTDPDGELTLDARAAGVAAAALVLTGGRNRMLAAVAAAGLVAALVRALG